MSEQNRLFDKVFGCIMGGTIGDAMGGPLETMHFRFIRELHDGRVTDLVKYERPADFSQPHPNGAYAWYDRAGTNTDDSYFQTLITKAIIKKNGRITAEDLGEVWLSEMDVDRAYFSMKNSYHKLRLTNTPAREIGIGNMQENCSCMCVGTVGVINACAPRQAALDAYEVSSLVHDGYSREAAGLIAAAVAEAMNPRATVQSIVDAALAHLPNGKLSQVYAPMVRALECADRARDTEHMTELFYEKLNIEWLCRQPPMPEDGRHSIGVNPCESAVCALAMFYKANGDPKETIIASANYGRDCDTIACMAGYIAGAYHGASGLPRKWIDTVLQANPEPDLRALARGLYGALLEERSRTASRLNLLSELDKTPV